MPRGFCIRSHFAADACNDAMSFARAAMLILFMKAMLMPLRMAYWYFDARLGRSADDL